MEVSALTLRVLLLFFPGVLCAMLVDALTVHRERTAAQFLTHAFVLGLTSYLLLYFGQWTCVGLAYALPLPQPLPVTFLNALLDEKLRIAPGEIALAAAIGVLLGTGVSAGVNHRILFRIGRKLHVTRRRGSPDLWSHVLNFEQTNWVSVRDLDHGFTYVGWVRDYSEIVDLAELWLLEATVFESATGTKLYEANALYLGRDPRSITVEVLPTDSRKRIEDGREDSRAVDAEQSQPERAQSKPDHSASGLHPGSADSAARARRKRRKGRR
jgi:hypothetical protein